MLTATVSNPPPLEYPCLRQGSSGLVVLFTQPKHGTVVFGGTGSYRESVGAHRDFWGMDYFTKFDGIVSISNSTL